MARRLPSSVFEAELSEDEEHSSRTKGVKKKKGKKKTVDLNSLIFTQKLKVKQAQRPDRMVKNIPPLDSRGHSQAVYRPLSLSSDLLKGVLLMTERENGVIGTSPERKREMLTRDRRHVDESVRRM